jgi:uncharacterized protein (DUF1015 family)
LSAGHKEERVAEIRPFRGLRYEEARSAPVGELIAPPYDVISAERDPRFRGRSPYNVIHLELPRAGAAGDPYRQAAALLEAWRREGVLRLDEQPGVYLYGQTYAFPGSEERTRFGVFTLLRLEEYEAGIVLPHEETMSRDREDRFRLLSECRAQISPIFGLYHAPGGVVSRWAAELGQQPAAMDATDDEGVRHRLWPIAEPERIAEWQRELAPLQMFIADGHHRYETALRYRAERGTEGGGAPAWSDYIMTLLVEMDDPGLVLFPTHRIVRARRSVNWEGVRVHLREWFEHREAPVPPPDEVAALLADPAGRTTIAMLAPPGEHLDVWTLRDPAAVDRVAPAGRSEAWRRLDVVALHRLVLAEGLGMARDPEAFEVRFTRDAAEAIQSVTPSSDTQTAAFFMRPPSIQDVRAVALAGEKMPEKSTYFWPKAVTGLVIYDSGGFVADL